MAHRWLKFWPQDWQSDAALRLCSLTARGMWMEMICLMHTGEPYGHLTLGGEPISNRQLGIMAGISEKDATKLVAELEKARVLSRNEAGVIFSRRMIRDYERSEEGRNNISKRWANGSGNTNHDSPPNRVPNGIDDRPPDTQEARSKKLEARERGAGVRPPPARQEKIPEDWLPSPDAVAVAKEAGVTDLVETVEQFVDYYTANGKPLADWDAAFRVWCRREPELRRNGK